MTPSRFLWTLYTDARGVRMLAGWADTGRGWWFLESSLVPVDSDKFRRFANGDFDFGRVLCVTGQPVRVVDVGANDLPADIETLWPTAKPWTPTPVTREHSRPRRWVRPADIDACINSWQAA